MAVATRLCRPLRFAFGRGRRLLTGGVRQRRGRSEGAAGIVVET